MSKLLKYELKKTWALKLMILGIAAAAEAAFLIALFLDNGNRRDFLGITILLLFFIALGGTILIGVQSVLTLHRDMNTKQGYMLYMTPKNSFQVLGPSCWKTACPWCWPADSSSSWGSWM